jgi:hypothetical protein
VPDSFPLYPVERRHLEALSDEVGILQHAIGSRPDPAHGYCTDDVARALQVDLLHQHVLGWQHVAESASRNLRFLEAAFDPMTGRFRNFRGIDGTWRVEVASEDSQGRALLALGETMSGASDGAIVGRARMLFERALPLAEGLRARRATASAMLAMDAALRADPTQATMPAYADLATRLMSSFERARVLTWPWPEARVTYENALLPRALIAAGSRLASSPMLAIGLRALDWLVAAQTAPAGHFSPVGNGWWSSGGDKSRFDQQPIEATATLLAAEAAFRATGAVTYRDVMERTYAWFLGGNDLGVDVAVPSRGASYDGLTRHGVNGNQGAESTLMWLIALEHIRAMRAREPLAAASGSTLTPMSVG